MTLQDKISDVKKQGYIIDVEIDMKLKYHRDKLKLVIRYKGKKLKELNGRYSNKNFGQQVNKKYAELWQKLNSKTQTNQPRKKAS